MTEEGERLIITKMILTDFKSYAGVKEIGPFHPKFSCIVGPNGSGKSNVIDAMLFVFGYKARRMRQTKLKDLIHKSAEFPNCTKARVEVNFAKCKNNEIIANSEFSIAREVFADSSSKYFFNKKTSSYGEITEFLKAEGIDLDHNRFLILQGEVEMISQMKPKGSNPSQTGLLEYIEDIIGTSEYIEPIQNKEKEIAQINVTRDDAIGRMTHAKKERDAIEESKNEAVQFLEWQHRLKVFNAGQINNKKKTTEIKLEEQEAQKKEVTDELDKYKKESEKFAEAIHEKETKVKEAEGALKKKKDEISLKTRELRDLKNELEELNMTYKGFEKRGKQSDEDKTKSVEDKTNAEVTKKELAAKIEKTQNDLERLQENYNNAKEILDELYNKSKDETQALQEELFAAQQVLSDKNVEATKIGTEVAAYQNEIIAIKRAFEENKKQVEDTKKKIEEAEELFNQSNNRLKLLEGKPEEARAKEEELNQKLNDMKEEYNQLQKRRHNVGLKQAELESQKRNTATKSKVVQGMEEFKRREGISGIYGRLGSLGTLDERYDIAISCACGGSLDFIVVDTDETAKLCINELKAKNLGRATFICLNKIAPGKKEDNAPQGSKRLIDLIKLKDEKFFPAFWYVLKDTLVTESVERAKQIGYGPQRRRVITEKGVLIEKSGTITGGGGKPRRKGAMDSFDEKELEAVNRELTEINSKLSKLDEEMRNIRRDIQNNDPSQLEAQYKKVQVDCQSYNDMKTQLIEKLEHMNVVQLTDEDERRIEELQSKIDEIQPQNDQAKKEAAKAKAVVDDIQDKIQKAGGAEYQNKKKEVEKLQKEIGQKNRSIAQMKQKNIQQDSIISECEKKFEESKKEFEEVQQEINRIKPKIEEKEQAKKELDESFQKASSEITRFEAELSQAVEELNNIKKERGEHNEKIEELERRFAEIAQVITQEMQNLEKMNRKLADAGITEEDLQELDELDAKDIEMEIANLTDKIDHCDANISSIDEYKKRDDAYQEELSAFQQIDNERSEIARQYEELRQQRLVKFLDGFHGISFRLRELYQMLTLGGDAELELVDTMDPFAEGIEFSVRPPGKSWKKIANLSGGEKTLSSLALVFSLHQFKPTPLYIMDEIDAALDFRNVSIIANYLKERTTDAQFIVISLRNNMFELADRLVGIFKLKDCTASLAIDPTKFTVEPEKKVVEEEDPENV